MRTDTWFPCSYLLGSSPRSTRIDLVVQMGWCHLASHSPNLKVCQQLCSLEAESSDCPSSDRRSHSSSRWSPHAPQLPACLVPGAVPAVEKQQSGLTTNSHRGAGHPCSHGRTQCPSESCCRKSWHPHPTAAALGGEGKI